MPTDDLAGLDEAAREPQPVRALDDPATLARAAQLIRAGLERKRLRERAEVDNDRSQQQ